MKLEDLMLKYFSLKTEAKSNRVIAIEDPKGNYKAASAQDVEAVLNNGHTGKFVAVKMSKGHKWYPLRKRGRRKRGRW